MFVAQSNCKVNSFYLILSKSELQIRDLYVFFTKMTEKHMPPTFPVMEG